MEEHKVRKLSVVFTAALMITALAAFAAGDALALRGGASGRGGGNVGLIYVSSQGLFFETFVAADPLPMKGRFQKIYAGTMGPTTEYGPGDPGYLGGRWWSDTNGDNVMDEGDHFFLCPLLGPGIEPEP